MSFEGFSRSTRQQREVRGTDSGSSNDTGKSVLAVDALPLQGFPRPAAGLRGVIPSQRVGSTSSESDSAACCVADGCSLPSSKLSFPTLGNSDNENYLTELWYSGSMSAEFLFWCQVMWGQMPARESWNIRHFIQYSLPPSKVLRTGNILFSLGNSTRVPMVQDWLDSLLACGERASRCEGSRQVPPLKEVAADWALPGIAT